MKIITPLKTGVLMLGFLGTKVLGHARGHLQFEGVVFAGFLPAKGSVVTVTVAIP